MTSVLRLLVAMCLTLMLTPSCQAEEGLDGTWWNRIPVDRRTGYTAGYIDCGGAEAKLHRFNSVSWDDLQARVTTHYIEHKEDLKRPVEAVLKQMARDYKVLQNSGGEVHPDEHGPFDGNYWRMLSPDGQVGFVEGYVDCLRTEKVKAPKFSKPPSWYRTQVSRWFGTRDDDQGVVRRDREDDKIAVVLLRLAKSNP